MSELDWCVRCDTVHMASVCPSEGKPWMIIYDEFRYVRIWIVSFMMMMSMFIGIATGVLLTLK